MEGLMQDWPLLVGKILDHANTEHPEREIVSRLVEGPIHRYTYADAHLRARKVAQALQALGAQEGDRIGTLAWNTHRHLETWYGAAGIGAVYHTLNPRLFTEQLAYIINHAEDRFIFVDLTFVPLLEAIQDHIPCVEGFVIYTDAAHMPDTRLRNAHCYEDLIADRDGDFRWLELDERAACGLCYTSGTTGNPKGVLYSHRSNVLHTLAINNADTLSIGSNDAIMPVVPLFHANAWSITFIAPSVGAKLIMPGALMDGASIYEMLETEQATCTAAVPTVWLMLLNYLEENGKKLSSLKRVFIGGAAVPRVMAEKFEIEHNIEVRHVWGMTEMSPLGTISTLKPGMSDLPADQQIDVKLKQGRAPFTVEMKITDDDGNELPRDGKTFGHLLVRGPAVVKSYFRGEGGEALDENGWFATGDVATIDGQGYMQITDRSKDVIKSGGEWISTIDLENLAVGHPDIAEAAVIGIAHPKWDERPLLVVVPKPDRELTKQDVLEYMDGKIAKWWMPDDVVFVDEIPHTATGKIQKTALRDQYRSYTLPTA